MTAITVNAAPAATNSFSGDPSDWGQGTYQRTLRSGSVRTIVVDHSGDWIMFNATRAGGFMTAGTTDEVNGTYEQVSGSSGSITQVDLN